ncbi:hypothetical protein MMC22_002893 [Lobaria immixta]|nr:hypothetical protein [Lobaria immixta]
MSKVGLIFLLLILLIPVAAISYILFARFRAQQAGLPPPPLSSYNPFSGRSRSSQNRSASSGILGWVRSKLQFSKSSGRGGGAYEQPLGARGRRGLDPDEAWDARVGVEADGYGAGGYYEEQELGLHPGGSTSGEAYAGGGYGRESHRQTLPDYGAEEMSRGRSRSREPNAYIGGGQTGLDERYDEEMGRQNPFGDEAERSSLRGISPRPAENEERGHKKTGGGDSPSERRSMFRENM